MSMTELERHLLDGFEKLQRELSQSQEDQDKRLSNLESRQAEQAQNLEQLANLFNELEPLLQRLNDVLQSA